MDKLQTPYVFHAISVQGVLTLDQYCRSQRPIKEWLPLVMYVAPDR